MVGLADMVGAFWGAKEGEEPLSPTERLIILCISVALVLVAGLMSGVQA
jgi:hypothetical protein